MMNEEAVSEIVKRTLEGLKIDEIIENKLEDNTHIKTLTEKINRLETTTRVVAYEPVSIIPEMPCNESLDLAKSVPEFDGTRERYMSWRQAVTTAMHLYDQYKGSSKYYQVVAIIRNKIVGTADQLLVSHNTVLNCDAILARLDHAFSDKRPLHILEQELSILRQGRMNVSTYFEKIEKHLTLITNKVLMDYNGNVQAISMLNQKYRDDALRVFISGLNKPLGDILFSSRPTDLPSALALAQELEMNQQRYRFANAFANYTEQDRVRNTDHSPINLPQFKRVPYNPTGGIFNNARYPQQLAVNLFNPNRMPAIKPQPMEVDPSTARFRTNFQTENRPQGSNVFPTPNLNPNFTSAQKRFRSSDRSRNFTPQKQQRINNIEEVEGEQ
jgi:hypothetical protein